MLKRLGAQPLTVNLFDADAIARVIPGHDTIINLATHIPHSLARSMLPGAWRENDRIRRISSGLLVDAALANGVQRFIQESFAPVYAPQDDAWITEDSPIRPVRYNRTVLDAEREVRRFAAGRGAGIVLRFAGFYGPDSTQLGDMLQTVRRGMLPLPGDPEAFFSWVSHDDAAAGVAAALGVPSGIYNVSDDEPVTRRVLGDTLASLLGVKPPRPMPRWVGRFLGSLGELMSRSQRISNRKLRGASGWRPRYPSIREGFRATLDALRDAA
jgi:nucleoside-diphosphate-sugar epimerase